MPIRIGVVMKTKECIHCEKFFECEGKEKDNPCLHFKERKEEQNNGYQFGRYFAKKYDSSRQQGKEVE